MYSKFLINTEWKKRKKNERKWGWLTRERGVGKKKDREEENVTGPNKRKKSEEMGEPKEEEGNQTRERKKGRKWRSKEAKERKKVRKSFDHLNM